MALVYFDSSAFVKLVVDEKGSDLASALWDACDAAISSRIAYAEVCGALSAARRNHDLDHHGARVAQRSWDEFWGSVRPVELTADVEQRAGSLARRHGLRGADAIHLASAVMVGSTDLIVAVWDRRLHEGVRAERLGVAPRSLAP